MNYFSILGVNIPYYSVMILLGLIISNILAYIIIKRYNLIIDDLILIETYCLSFSMLGAKILYLFIFRNNIDFSRILDWNYIEPYIKGGFVFYGGLIGGIIGILLVKKFHKIDVVNYMSKLIFFIPLAHGFGRIGCYLSGCCYGIPYKGPFSVTYHDIQYSLCDVSLFPIQLVEAIFLFIAAIVLFYLSFKKKASLKLILFYFYYYSVLRFFLEFYRYDSQRGTIGILSTSQFISIVIFIITVLIHKYINKNLKYKIN